MPDNRAKGFAWQLRVWDRMADVYRREIDTRFGPVVEAVLKLADLRPGETVIDLGTGTGAVAILAATQVGTTGRIKAVDISPEMLTRAGARLRDLQITNIDLAEGSAEAIPADDRSIDAVVASLTLMYVIDRDAAAKDIARVLRPGGRFVAAVWGGPAEADIVKFQQSAGRLRRRHRSRASVPGRSPILPNFYLNCEPLGSPQNARR
jgi:ubiquinone/menaquinone biosynthesis C-methylase UbiE